MTTSLHSESTVVFKRFLANLRKILEKARDHAAAHKIDEAAILGDRLFPDMFPMSRQVQIASDAAKGAVARLAGLEIPSFADTEASFDELISRTAETALDLLQNTRSLRLEWAVVGLIVVEILLTLLQWWLGGVHL